MTVVLSSLSSATPYVSPGNGVHSTLLALYPPEIGCAASAMDGNVSPVYATLTDDAYTYLARAATEGMAIRVVSFSVGTSGYDPSFPAHATPVVVESRVLTAAYTGPVVSERASTDGTMYSYGCYVPQSITATIGEVALIAQILHSPADPTEVGTQFTYAVGHLPMVPSHRFGSVGFRVIIRG